MQKLTTALLALALSIPVMAFAQDGQNSGSSDQQAQRHEQQEQNQSAGDTMVGANTQPMHHMMGMVGDDGKSFTSDNKVYQVANPGALKKYNGQNVDIKFQFNSETNKIHVSSVNAGQ